MAVFGDQEPHALRDRRPHHDAAAIAHALQQRRRNLQLPDLPAFGLDKDRRRRIEPPQRLFDSTLWNALRRFDASLPVFVEAESRKIGQLQVPSALLERMREGRCIVVQAPVAERVRFLIAEYRHFLEDPQELKARLECLTSLYGHAVIKRWLALVDERAWDDLVTDLLVNHYDPAYRRSTLRNYPDLAGARVLTLDRLSPEAIDAAASDLAAELLQKAANATAGS